MKKKKYRERYKDSIIVLEDTGCELGNKVMMEMAEDLIDENEKNDLKLKEKEEDKE